MKFLQNLFPVRSKYIKVTNLNDVYAQVLADTYNALGGNTSVNSYRSRKTNKLYILEFKGDIMATAAYGLSQEITAIINSANPLHDEVLVQIESSGGAVHSYGYAASQIKRLLDVKIKTTISVDKIAASGGYMMACVSDKIIAAPFAILGSIGVVAELPNISRLIKNLGIEWKQYTAGKYKRTVGTFAPITEEGEEKFKNDLFETYELFKHHILTFRPQTKIEEVATGEHWYGSQALKLGLIDGIMTSDEFIIERLNTSEILKIRYIANKTWAERLQDGATSLLEKIFIKVCSFYLQVKYF